MIYEGETEDTVIKMIFDALNVDEKRDGIFLWNASGQGNIKNNLYGLVQLAREQGIDVFLILDHDVDWSDILEDFKRRGYLKEDMYHVWERDFELDNFTIDKIIERINSVLEQKFLERIEKDEVVKKISSSSKKSIKIISDLINQKNGVKLEDVISKKDLAQILIEFRNTQIKRERYGDGWKPLLPIEKILYKIFVMIPRVIG